MALVPAVVQQAAALIDTERSAAADILDAFTNRCLRTTVTALKDLFTTLDSEG